MDQVRVLARQSLGEARRSVQALRPEPLEHSHLPDAITDMANGWSQTCAVTWTVEITGTPQPLITSIEVTLFRVGQEALANVAKHTKASALCPHTGTASACRRCGSGCAGRVAPWRSRALPVRAP